MTNAVLLENVTELGTRMAEHPLIPYLSWLRSGGAAGGVPCRSWQQCCTQKHRPFCIKPKHFSYLFSILLFVPLAVFIIQGCHPSPCPMCQRLKETLMPLLDLAPRDWAQSISLACREHRCHCVGSGLLEKMPDVPHSHLKCLPKP